jgi:hypothetical protein
MENMMTAREVMAYLRISRPTLWRYVYLYRSLPAFHPPGATSGRTSSGSRKPNKLLFNKAMVESLIRPVSPESERAVKRKAKKLAQT